MNPPPNNVAIFGFLQKHVPEAEKTLAKSPPMPLPHQFLVSPAVPAIGLNYLNAPKLPGFGGGASLFRTDHTAKFYDAPVLPLDDHTRQSVPGQIVHSEQATIGTHINHRRPLRRSRALRGEPSNDRDCSDCSTTAVRGTGVQRSLRRTSVHFWPYQAVQRQNRDRLHRRRSYNHSTTAQAGSLRQNFSDRGFSSFSTVEAYGGIVNEHVAGPFGLRTPLVFVPLSISQDPFQMAPDPFNGIPSTARNVASTAPPVPGSTARVFAEASVQTIDRGDSPTVSNASSHVPPSSNAQPINGNDSNDGEQAEGSTRPLNRRHTGLEIGELMPPTPLRRSTGSTDI